MLLCSCAQEGPMTVISEENVTEMVQTDAETEAPLPVGSLKVISLTEAVAGGQLASVTVKGLPNTEYDITVTYSSVSEASGLENKVSDSDGLVSWSWRVGSNTNPGRYTIDIQCESEKITLYFEVVPKE